MKKLTLLTATLIALLALPAFGQVREQLPAKPIAGAASPYGNQKAIGHPDARAIRAEREKAVARTGVVARRLIEEHAPAVQALSACTPEVGKKLAEAYNAGVLDKLKIDDLLKAVAETVGGGDDTVLWLIQPDHAAELQDPDASGAFCASPLDAALGIRELSAMAADYRAGRLARQQEEQKIMDQMKQGPASPPPAPPPDWQPAAILFGGGAAIIAFFWVLKRWTGRGKAEPTRA